MIRLTSLLEQSTAGAEAQKRGLKHVGWGKYADPVVDRLSIRVRGVASSGSAARKRKLASNHSIMYQINTLSQMLRIGLRESAIQRLTK